MISHVHTIFAETHDMSRGAAFYRDVLGLKPLVESPYWTSFDLGGIQLALHHPIDDGKPRGRGWTVNVATESLSALKQTLMAAGVETGEYHETPSGVVMDFWDPDGNVLQAIQPGSTLADIA